MFFWQTAWMLDQGKMPNIEASICFSDAKLFQYPLILYELIDPVYIYIQSPIGRNDLHGFRVDDVDADHDKSVLHDQRSFSESVGRWDRLIEVAEHLVVEAESIAWSARRVQECGVEISERRHPFV